jgi:hypothetical protein
MEQGVCLPKVKFVWADSFMVIEHDIQILLVVNTWVVEPDRFLNKFLLTRFQSGGLHFLAGGNCIDILGISMVSQSSMFSRILTKLFWAS